MEIQGTRLEFRLEHVGDVIEEDVIEELCEERAEDTAFGVVGFPS